MEILNLKRTVTKMKISLARLNNSFELVEESVKIMQRLYNLKKQKEKRIRKNEQSLREI